MLDFLIKNGQVFVGDGGKPIEAYIGIKGDRIVYIGNNPINANIYIDASNMVVSPGFIDTHGHSEFTLLADRRAEGKIYQGITTEINGNCGLSAAPLYGEASERREEELKELGVKERWSTFKEYFSILSSKGIGINFATLCGHGNLRASVNGYKEDLSYSSLLRMKGLLKEAIDEGAKGLSTGLQYPPGMYSQTEEIIELAKVLNEYENARDRFVYTSHMRSEGDKLIESINETVRIGKEANVNIHISHLKTSGIENWVKIDESINLIEIERTKGMRLTADRYPYTASSTDLDILLPEWVFEGGNEQQLKRLKDPVMSRKIKDSLSNKNEDFWKSIFISSLNKNKWMEGLNIHDISERLCKNPADVFLNVLIEEKNRVGAIFFFMSEENLRSILKLPYVMIGSDSSARSFSGITCTGKPHPRGFGSFPRFIGRYVREYGLITLSEAIRRITYLPAQIFNLRKRGLIKEGFYADLCIFDYNNIIDNATFKEPFRKPDGIFYLFINGSPVIKDGQYTGMLSGRILR
jgi:N-acyl-D-amino-acid deacylase